MRHVLDLQRTRKSCCLYVGCVISNLNLSGLHNFKDNLHEQLHISRSVDLFQKIFFAQKPFFLMFDESELKRKFIKLLQNKVKCFIEEHKIFCL